MMRSSPFPFPSFRLTSRPSAAPSSLTACETPTPSHHSRVMRACAFGMGSLALWTLVLAAPVNALALPSHEKPLPTYHKPTLPKPVDDPAWHTIDYHAAEKALAKARAMGTVPKTPAPVPRRPAGLSLLDEVGRLNTSANPAQAAEWKRLLHRPQLLAPAQSARLHLWLGELALAHDEAPEQALWHFAQVQKQCRPASPLYGLARYDSAIAAYYEGAYAQAHRAFAHLLTAKPALQGFDRSTATLFMRHASACAGYHAEREAMGIPEPPKLDPLCGAAAVAVALKAAGMHYDKKTVLANLRVTGRGSTLQDVVEGAQKLGLAAHVTHAGDKGLMALPKPLVAYVEHDHFVSLLRADAKGVSYLCSDCGKWPGGRIDLTWRQWHKMEATAYVALVAPGSALDDAFSAQAAPTGNSISSHAGGRPGVPGSPAGIQMASSSPKVAIHLREQLLWMRRLQGNGITQPEGGTTVACGGPPNSQQCLCQTQCSIDGTHGGASGGAGGNTPGGGAANPGGGGGGETGGMGGGSGPVYGIGINVGNGEVGYTPPPDMTIYNPSGPSLGWSFTYQSLRGNSASQGYESTDFGQGFSHSYNLGVIASTYTAAQVGSISPRGSTRAGQRASCGQVGGGGGSVTFYLVEPNGSRVSVTAPQMPSATTPHVVCSVQAGIPMLAEWDYNSSTGTTYFVFTQPDRSQWTMQTGYDCLNGPPSNNGGPRPQGYALWYPLSQIKDNVGNAVHLNYTAPAAGYFPLLTSITDKNNAALLTFTRDANSAISSVSDRYNRSVYYHVGTYQNGNVTAGYPQSLQELDHISQVVPTGTASPPDRHVFGYQNVNNGEGAETIPFLHTVTEPSATGSGTQTATINYLPNYCTVASVVDANGNKRAYNQTDASHTQVTVTDAANNVTYRYTAGYDMNMSVTSISNGTVDGNGHNTQIIANYSYADANDPLRPSTIEDGVGYAAGGVNGGHNAQNVGPIRQLSDHDQRTGYHDHLHHR